VLNFCLILVFYPQKNNNRRFPVTLLSWLPFSFAHYMDKMCRMLYDRVVWRGQPHTQATATANFDEWNRRVIASVPADRLLVFRVSDGWAPLCAFLGVPVPAVPFPRVNDTNEFVTRIKRLGYAVAGSLGVLVAGLIGGLFFIVRKQLLLQR